MNTSTAGGIALAVLGAVTIAFGTRIQHRAIVAASGTPARRVRGMLANRAWLSGTLLIGVAVALQLGSLALAPLAVVQPVGVVAVVLTSALNGELRRGRRSPTMIWGLALVIAGVTAFVAVAASVTAHPPVTDAMDLTVLVALALALAVIVPLYAVWRTRLHPLMYVAAGGILNGFVASLAATVLRRLVGGNLGLLTLAAGAGLGVAFVLGAFFVQASHALASADVVLAGLTVVDPVVAVLIGSFALREAAGAPAWAAAAFIASGTTAVAGVLLFARHHERLASLESQRLQHPAR